VKGDAEKNLERKLEELGEAAAEQTSK